MLSGQQAIRFSCTLKGSELFKNFYNAVINHFKIAGLDPAGSFFTDMNPTVRLDPSDADFVDVLHTGAGYFGSKYHSNLKNKFTQNNNKRKNLFFDYLYVPLIE